MSRTTRSERLASKGRPKRRAAATHFFKYQLSTNPGRAEENDLKKALQASLLEEHKQKHQQQQRQQQQQNGKKSSQKPVVSSTNSSDVSRGSNINSSSSSNESAGFAVLNSEAAKRTRSGIVHSPSPMSKRVKLTNGQHKATSATNNVCDGNLSVLVPAATTRSPQDVNKAIRTYSRNSQIGKGTDPKESGTSPQLPKTSTPKQTPSANEKDKDSSSPPKSVSRSTQTKSAGLMVNTTTTTSLASSTPSISTTNSRSPQVTTNSSTTNSKDLGNRSSDAVLAPFQDQYLKFKRESKNYAYAKMTALKVSTSKSPSGNSKSVGSKKVSPNGILHNKSTNNKDSNKTISPKTNNNSMAPTTGNTTTSSTKKTDNPITNGNLLSKNANQSNKTKSESNSISVQQNCTKTMNVTSQSLLLVSRNNSIPVLAVGEGVNSSVQFVEDDCLLDDTISLSMTPIHNQTNVNILKKRVPQGSWSLIGIPEEKIVYLRGDEPPRRLICYPAIKHVEGDVIQVKDSVLLRSGARKTDLPYIAKVCSFWEDAETGGVMMSLFWYYRPEHTEEGRKPHHLSDEIFASRHRDVDSVECIEDKCYVLTFNEYCRYRKRCKMEQVNTTWSLADAIIPASNESYPRRNRIPDSDVNPELVFCCRQIYDSRMKRLVKNPLINPKYGHI